MLKLALPLLAAMIATSPALAHPVYSDDDSGYVPTPPRPPLHMHADGWVGDGGRILHDGETQLVPASTRPANRQEWLADCNHRLTAANEFRDAPTRFEDACRDWLAFYEHSGEARDGYGFNYAIPVALETISIPGRTFPLQAPQPERLTPPARHRPVIHDKRVKI